MPGRTKKSLSDPGEEDLQKISRVVIVIIY